MSMAWLLICRCSPMEVGKRLKIVTVRVRLPPPVRYHDRRLYVAVLFKLSLSIKRGAVEMAYIYKITNKQNQKCYIGKTYKTNPLDRFEEHKKDSLKYIERPLYRAFAKYGFSNFDFEVIEETDYPDDREGYWINFFNSYGSTGYNATLGGDGKKLFNDEEIIADYLLMQNQTEVAMKHGCHAKTVGDILDNYGVEKIDSHTVLANKTGKKVQMLSKDTEEVLQTFNSQMEAARFLIENNYSKIRDLRSLAAKIGLVCRGKRKTCSGFKWRRLDSP